jgi:SAM-dependent methyltransferase
VSEAFYEQARLYDLMFPGAPARVDFYLDEARRAGGRVLELACGTGFVLLPIAAAGLPVVGMDLSVAMLSEARRKANDLGVNVELLEGDMRTFDFGAPFDLIFVTGNSLLHLHETDDLIACFRSVARHLTPSGRFVFDVFNPSVHLLAGADGVRRFQASFLDPERGEVSVDVARTYDVPAQVTREVWYFSSSTDADFVVAPLEVRSIFPQELPLLVAAGGLRLIDRRGDFMGGELTAEAPQQVCVCAVGKEVA